MASPPRVHEVLAQAVHSAAVIPHKGAKLEALQQIAIQQVLAGELKEVEDTIQLIVELDHSLPQTAFVLGHETHPHYLRMVEFYSTISLNAYRIGFKQWGQEKLSVGTMLAQKEPDPYSKYLDLVSLANAFAKLGMSDKKIELQAKARNAAEQAPSSSGEILQAKVLLTLAEIEVANEDNVRAKQYLSELLAKIQMHNSTGFTLTIFPAVALLQARLGEVDAAQETLAILFKKRADLANTPEVSYDFSLKNAIDLSRTAIVFVQGGHSQQAKKALERSVNELAKLPQTDSYRRSAGWSRISQAAAALGDLDFSIQAETIIEDPSYKYEPRRTILNALYKAGKRERALALVRDQYKLFADLGLLELTYGHIKEALTILESLEVLDNSIFIKSEARGRLLTDGPDVALQWALTQESPNKRTYALLGIAECISSSHEPVCGAHPGADKIEDHRIFD